MAEIFHLRLNNLNGLCFIFKPLNEDLCTSLANVSLKDVRSITCS